MSSWVIRGDGAHGRVRRSGLTDEIIEEYAQLAAREIDTAETIRRANNEAVEACMAMVGDQLARYDRIRLQLTDWIKRYDYLVSVITDEHKKRAPKCDCYLCTTQAGLRRDIDEFWKNNS
jgi:hypothetical protein